MDRGAATALIFPERGIPAHLPPWLVDTLQPAESLAEVSLHPNPDGELGFRLFARGAALANLSARLSAADCQHRDEELRRTYPLMPGYWMRVRVDGAGRVGEPTFNYTVDPREPAPLSTLRRMARKFGDWRQERLPRLLEIGDVPDASQRQWGFSVREGHCRLFGRVAREKLGALLDELVSEGVVDADGRSEALLQEHRISASPYCWLSWEPGRVSIDYEDVATDERCLESLRGFVFLPPFDRCSYFKWAPEPERRAVYVPWWRFKLWNEERERPENSG